MHILGSHSAVASIRIDLRELYTGFGVLGFIPAFRSCSGGVDLVAGNRKEYRKSFLAVRSPPESKSSDKIGALQIWSAGIHPSF